MNPDDKELILLCERFLAEGYAYEVLGKPYVSDNMWDTMCKILDFNKHRLPEWFLELVSLEQIKTATASGTKWRQEDIERSEKELAKYGEWDLDGYL